MGFLYLRDIGRPAHKTPGDGAVHTNDRNAWSDFHIGRATENDATGVLHCLRMAFEAYRNSYTPGAFRDTVLSQEAFQQRLSSMRIFIALEGDNQVVGTVSCMLIQCRGPLARNGDVAGMAGPRHRRKTIAVCPRPNWLAGSARESPSTRRSPTAGHAFL